MWVHQQLEERQRWESIHIQYFQKKINTISKNFELFSYFEWTWIWNFYILSKNFIDLIQVSFYFWLFSRINGTMKMGKN